MNSIIVWGWILFAAFLVSMIAMSVRAMRATKSVGEYLVAPKAYGPLTIGLALGASMCSAAATMGNPGLVFSLGWPGMWYALGYGAIVAAWALTSFVLSKVGGKVGASSLPDFMAKRFQSKFLRIFIAIVTLSNVFYIAGQFIGVGYVFETILGIPYHIGIIGASIFITAYIFVGGSHSNILNAAIQGFVMVVAIVVVVVAVVRVTGGPAQINEVLTAQDPNLSWDVFFSNPRFGPFTGVGIMIVLGLTAVSPQNSRLWFSLKSEKDVPKTILICFIFMVGMGAMMLFGGLGSRIISPESAPDLSILESMKKVALPVFAALVGVGVLAAIMSTLSGLFLSVATAFSNDIYLNSFVPKYKKDMPKEKAEKNTVTLTRVFVVIAMVVGLSIGFNPPGSMTMLMWSGIGTLVAGMAPGLILGCTWRGITKTAAVASSVAGTVVYLFCYFIVGNVMKVPEMAIPWGAALVGVIVNLIVAFVVSKFTKPYSKEFLDSIFSKNDTDKSAAK